MEARHPRTARIHLGLALAEVLCASAFAFEITRALDGNTLSWAYVVEWPILGAYALYMWRRLLREERGEERAATPEEPESPQLREWNEYLARVHADRPDGEPTEP